MLALGYGSLFDLVDPPKPPRRYLGLCMSTVKVWHGALSGAFCTRFFASMLDSNLESFLIRLGVFSGSFWHPFGSPNRIKVDQEWVLSGDLFAYVDCHADLRFLRLCCFVWIPRRVQDRPRTGSRRLSREAPPFLRSSEGILGGHGSTFAVLSSTASASGARKSFWSL